MAVLLAIFITCAAMIVELMLLEVLGAAFALWEAVVVENRPTVHGHQVVLLASRIHSIVINAQFLSQLAQTLLLASELVLKGGHAIMCVLVSMIVFHIALLTSKRYARTVLRRI